MSTKTNEPIENTLTLKSAVTITFAMLASLAFLLQTPSANAASATETVSCGLSIPDTTPIPSGTYARNDPNNMDFENNVSPAVVITTVARSDGAAVWGCTASVSTFGPSIRTSIQGLPSTGNDLGASGSVLVNYDISELQLGGPGGNIPIVAQILTTMAFDPINTLTNNSMFINNSFNVSTDPAVPGVSTFFSRLESIRTGGGCFIATGGCTFNDILYGAAAVGPQWYNFAAGVGTADAPSVGGFIDGPANASVFADPVFMVDPDATFGSGLRYADFYEVVMPSNITQATAAVPLPAALPLFVSALLGFGFIGRRRRNGK